MPVCWIIAGPNGAGKTTFALEYLPKVAQCSRFINADLIAAGLSPIVPEDEIITRRDALIDALEQRLKQQIETEKLFTIRWSVI